MIVMAFWKAEINIIGKNPAIDSQECSNKNRECSKKI